MYNYMYGMPYMPCMYDHSYLRVLHASPDAPGVDIYVNNMIVKRNLKYGKFTPYMPLMPGRYNIKVFPTGMMTSPVIDTVVNVMPNSDYTVAATGKLDDIQPLVINDTAMMLSRDKAQIKFVHLSPDAPPVDITLPDGTVLFSNIPFRGVSQNIAVDPGRYTLQARIAGTDRIVLTVPNVVLQPDKYYTVYAIGLVKGEPSLQALIALDKASY